VTEAERESLAAAKREEEERSLPLMAAALDVEGEERSSCLSRTSLIRFRSTEVTSDLDPTPPRSLYITVAGQMIRLDSFGFSTDHNDAVADRRTARVLRFSFRDDAIYNLQTQTMIPRFGSFLFLAIFFFFFYIYCFS